MPMRAARLRGERIHGERVARIDGVVARLQKRLRDELENVVRAVAEHDLLGVDAVARRERGLELEAVAVRIAAQIVGRRGDRRAHRGARAARVLVGRELDDLALGEPEFAGELADRLAGQVRRDAPDVLRRERRRGREVNRRCEEAVMRIPNKPLPDTIPTA